MFNWTKNAKSLARELQEKAPGTVNAQAHKRGMDNDEPLIVMLDCLHRYAQAHAKRYESKLCDDGVLGVYWLNAAKAIRSMLCGDGAYAMANDISTDSKDNGVCESMFWDAMTAAGFEQKDM